MFLDDKKIILASSSPRRKEILEKAGYNPVVIKSFGEINIVGKEYTKKLVCECAREKAVKSYKNYDNCLCDESEILIAADTVVVNDGIIYGKPKDREDAIYMLKSLSGKTHIVCTAICIGFYMSDVIDIVVNEKNIEEDDEDDKERVVFVSGSEETKVTFKKLTDKEIEEYVDSKKPFDKAGAYGIQDEGFTFVEKIEGNIDNVIGFPMKRFEEILADL